MLHVKFFLHIHVYIWTLNTSLNQQLDVRIIVYQLLKAIVLLLLILVLVLIPVLVVSELLLILSIL